MQQYEWLSTGKENGMNSRILPGAYIEHLRVYVLTAVSIQSLSFCLVNSISIETGKLTGFHSPRPIINQPYLMSSSLEMEANCNLIKLVNRNNSYSVSLPRQIDMRTNDRRMKSAQTIDWTNQLDNIASRLHFARVVLCTDEHIYCCP